MKLNILMLVLIFYFPVSSFAQSSLLNEFKSKSNPPETNDVRAGLKAEQKYCHYDSSNKLTYCYFLERDCDAKLKEQKGECRVERLGNGLVANVAPLGNQQLNDQCEANIVKSCLALMLNLYQKNMHYAAKALMNKVCNLRDPIESPEMCYTSGLTKVGAGDYKSAISFFETGCKLRNINPDNKSSILSCAFLSAYNKDRDLYLEILPLIENYCEVGNQGDCYNTACVHSRFGDQTAALTSLKKSMDKGFSNLKHLMEDPDLKNLRVTQKFKEFMKEVASRTPVKKDN